MSDWKAETLKEWKQSPTSIWRAQLSTAPDGKKFLGIRKFAVKKDGTEQYTAAGFNFPAEGLEAEMAIEHFIDLMLACRRKPVAPTTAKVKPPKKQYVMIKDKKFFVRTNSDTGKHVVSTDVNKARLFTADCLPELGSRWKAINVTKYLKDPK